ncbi:sigma 54-interacting transcriptional regulator [Cytophagaceae bacterium YF14B1]|uniref:Sigma 54-interacting transcriptional regulator n=1 Tax=Xanthocytophaga flava TaxID=3048013 RepID=A0AAE3QIP6_9BACT|nr:sigma 54-interacting transcriptional regulator [Xanthocytophaga flavus]MDJ1480037.1 sigma 54-interacting transcriptional regulator [Xanthocytophaga flavus]
MSASSTLTNNLLSFVNQTFLQELIQELPVVVFAISPNQTITCWNKECERTLGYSSKEIQDTTILTKNLFGHTPIVKSITEAWDNPNTTLPYRYWEGEIKAKDGSVRYLSVNYHVRNNFVLEGLHLWCIGTDLTDKVQGQRIMQVNQERLSLVTKAAKIGFWDWNAHTNEVYYSQECFDIMGYKCDEFSHAYEKWLEFIHPEDRTRVQNKVRDCLHTKCDFYTELRFKAQNGNYIWLFLQANVFEWDAQNKAVRIVGIISDITLRKRTEQDLQEALAKVEELKESLVEENLQLKQELQESFRYEDIISISDTYKKVLRQVEQVAPTDATVLVLGETGTGKSLIANTIHRLSSRVNQPLIKVNCAALPANLIESELFGYEKGAFTGAYTKKIGRFELADKGTIFLDEIGDLPMELQAKLLRVLQEGEFEPLGGNRTHKVDVRIIAATNRNLEELVQKGSFRADLYYRLNVFPIVNPPLRERKEDIPLLVKYFVNKYNAKTKKQITVIPKKTLQQLESYNWPGNIRELKNTIERAIVLSTSTKLEMDAWFQNPANTISTDVSSDIVFDTLEEHERKHILEALKRTEGRVTGPRGAGKLLGINDKTLQSRMRKLGINRLNEFK